VGVPASPWRSPSDGHHGEHPRDPDNGQIVAGYFGSLLLAGAYLAIACMTSAMTRNQVVAFILSVVICLFLILAGFNPVDRPAHALASPALVDTVAAFSVVTHFDGFQRGVIDLRDLVSSSRSSALRCLRPHHHSRTSRR